MAEAKLPQLAWGETLRFCKAQQQRRAKTASLFLVCAIVTEMIQTLSRGLQLVTVIQHNIRLYSLDSLTS